MYEQQYEAAKAAVLANKLAILKAQAAKDKAEGGEGEGHGEAGPDVASQTDFPEEGGEDGAAAQPDGGGLEAASTRHVAARGAARSAWDWLLVSLAKATCVARLPSTHPRRRRSRGWRCGRRVRL